MEEKLSFRCANCGETVEFQIPSNWRDAEVKDLDGRPKETEKFSIARAIQKCPKCHYVSFDISKNIIKDKNILSTPEYNEILENRSLPEVVNNYLAMGFAYEKQEEYHNSSRAYLCASWLLESIGKVKDSKSLLEKAAFCLLLYINSKPFKENPDLAAFLRAVDVLRQIEKFDNAKKLASFAIKKTKAAPEKNILEYELLLCSEQISQSKEIPEYIESPTSLKQIVAEFLSVDYGDNLRKLRVFNQMREYLKKCKIAELKEGVSLIEDTSALINFSDNEIELLKEIVGNGVEQYGKTSFDKPQEVEKSTKRVIYKIDDFNKPLDETKVAAAEENVGIIASAIDDLKVEKDKNLDIVYLDEEFQGSEIDPAEELEDTKNVEKISEVEDTEKVEDVTEVEDTEKVEKVTEVEDTEDTKLEPEVEEPEVEPEIEPEPEEPEEPEEVEPEPEEPEVEEEPEEPEEEPEVDDEAADVEEATEDTEEIEDTETSEEEPELDDEAADVEETTEDTEEVEDPDDPEEEPEVEPEEPEFEEDTEELEDTEESKTDDPVFVPDTEDIENETEPEVDDETPSVEEDTEDPEVEEDTDDPEVEEDTEDTDDAEELEEDIEPPDDPEVEEDSEDTDDAEELEEDIEPSDDPEVEEDTEDTEELYAPEEDIAPPEEPDPLSEIEQQSSNDSDNKGIILTLASFDGKISIGEVQSLFECSYTKAKDILDEIVKDGKLAWTIDEEIFEFVAK